MKSVVCSVMAILSLSVTMPCWSAPADDLPALGGSAGDLVSPAAERELGEKLSRDIRRGAPLLEDAALKYFTETLIAELAAASDLTQRDLMIALIDSPALNAFAAPGGIVGVNAGLFLNAGNVHELSAVLAHELAHLSQRHFARQVEFQKKQALPMLAAMLASIAVMATVGGDAGLAAITSTQAAAQDSALRYSRGREQEADRIGIDTLARAGLDPHAVAGMFERMARASRYDRKPPEFLLTHPVSETRVADGRNQAAQYPTKVYADRVEFQFMQARARVHYAETPSLAVRTFEDEIRQGRMQPDAAHYGLALALSNAGRHKEALTTVAELAVVNPDDLYIRTLQADVLMAANEAPAARDLLAQALRVNPDNPLLAMHYAQALRQLKLQQEAVAVLQRQATLRPNDTDIWYELAETAGLAGDIVTVHAARAEYFQLHGDFDKAIEHLQYALRLLNESNFQLTAKINQRIVDLRDLQQRLS